MKRSSVRRSLWNLDPFHSWRQKLILNAICSALRSVPTQTFRIVTFIQMHVSIFTVLLHTTSHYILSYYYICKNPDSTVPLISKSVLISCRQQLKKLLNDSQMPPAGTLPAITKLLLLIRNSFHNCLIHHYAPIIKDNEPVVKKIHTYKEQKVLIHRIKKQCYLEIIQIKVFAVPTLLILEMRFRCLSTGLQYYFRCSC